MSAWQKDAAPGATWMVSSGRTRRITEDGILRITEQGDVRIIEHEPMPWTAASARGDIWTKE